jgi:hypothetical protein
MTVLRKQCHTLVAPAWTRVQVNRKTEPNRTLKLNPSLFSLPSAHPPEAEPLKPACQTENRVAQLAVRQLRGRLVVRVDDCRQLTVLLREHRPCFRHLYTASKTLTERGLPWARPAQVQATDACMQLDLATQSRKALP